MVDLRSRTHGAGATNGVNLVVMAYDGRTAPGPSDAETAHYLDARVHPGDRRAPGQTSLALVSKRNGSADEGFRNSAPYSSDEFASIREAAGENVTELTDSAGAVVGRVYGVKADLLISDGVVVVNTKTVEPTDLSVGPDDEGRDIRAQIRESVSVAREALAAAGQES